MSSASSSLIWIYRVAANLRVLGVRNLTNSPGWSVGWYFIPIANLWKPYQAMKEIWQASDKLQQWRGSSVPRLLPAWWALWLLEFLIPVSVGVALGFHANVAGQWLSGNISEVINRLIDMPATLVFAHMMGRIWQMQSMQAAPPSAPTLMVETNP